MSTKPLKAAGLKRRQLMSLVPLLGLAGLGVAQSSALPSLQQRRDSRALLGTQVDIAVEGPDAARLVFAVESAYQEMARLSAMMSRYDPASALSAVNRAAGLHAVAVPPELMAALQQGQRLHRESNGLFDMTVGSLKSWQFEVGNLGQVPESQQLANELSRVGAKGLRIDPLAGTAALLHKGAALDLGGVAKLPILAAGLRRLQENGIENALINGGGDVLYSGSWQGRPWRVGLRDPRRSDRLLGVLPLSGQGVLAASGDYERFFLHKGERHHHILDPRSGQSSQGPISVHLLARDVETVNGLGAIIMLGGTSMARQTVAQHAELELLLVNRDRSEWQTPGMQRALKRA
ncbi:FAD:protein FMN transferase [Paucibacter sp. KCTC 42545]|uniref:FAD:protein FMN transferase n=1 Tax=Paucibacter sp. KCTC 42545 TaxID=1768242 RepID=UPI001E5688FB|nr:FAD:protein FMN transferase [Paucibacter sp. KCTC 42545]